MQSHANPWIEVTVEHSCATPRVFLLMSDQEVQEFNELIGIIGEIQPGHGNPTKEEIVTGLCELSISLRNHDWKLFEEGNSYLARFPSPTELEVALCCTSIPYKGYEAGSMYHPCFFSCFSKWMMLFKICTILPKSHRILK